jgi:hypothetical protein
VALLELDEGDVRAARGLDELDGGAELIEACAVLTEIEAVGGPEEIKERPGLLNRVEKLLLPPAESLAE